MGRGMSKDAWVEHCHGRKMHFYWLAAAAIYIVAGVDVHN